MKLGRWSYEICSKMLPQTGSSNELMKILSTSDGLFALVILVGSVMQGLKSCWNMVLKKELMFLSFS